jgi:dipeptide/tripeptide permease
MRISWEVVVVFLTSTIKFLPAPFAAAGLGMSYWQAFLLVGVGGTLGVTIFFFLSKTLFERNKKKLSTKKKFTKLNKSIIKVKQRFGLVGIALITPPLISIPVGTIIAVKFYKHRKDLLPMLWLSVWFWNVILTTAVHQTMSLF